LEPRGLSVDAKGEVHPLFARPFGGRGWEGDLSVDPAVHLAALRDRSVVVDDDLGAGGDLLQLADESESLASGTFGVAGVADDKGKFQNDAELLGSLRDVYRLIGGDAFLHLFERPIGA